MEYLYVILFFIFGTVFGSFYNVVGFRIPKKESIISPPSHCTSCQHELKMWELIPVLSYIFLRGKCSQCQNKISLFYPLMELITGILFAWSYIHFGLTYELIVAILFGSLLVIITVSDLEYMVIPNKILLFFGGLLIVARIIVPLDPWWNSIVGAIFGFTLLWIIALASKGGMGGGDIKLYAVIGLVLGVGQTLLSLVGAALIGLIYGIAILSTKKERKRVPIPFGPAIALASWGSYLYGAPIVNWYISLLSF